MATSTRAKERERDERKQCMVSRSSPAVPAQVARIRYGAGDSRQAGLPIEKHGVVGQADDTATERDRADVPFPVDLPLCGRRVHARLRASASSAVTSHADSARSSEKAFQCTRAPGPMRAAKRDACGLTRRCRSVSIPAQTPARRSALTQSIRACRRAAARWSGSACLHT